MRLVRHHRLYIICNSQASAPGEGPEAQRDQLVRNSCRIWGNHARIWDSLGKLTSTSGQTQSLQGTLTRLVLCGGGRAGALLPAVRALASTSAVGEWGKDQRAETFMALTQ